MSDPLQRLLARGAGASPFNPNSRYYGVDVAKLERPDGAPIPYLRRRFLPAPDNLAPVQEHTIQDGDRLDNLAAQYLGDPEQFWQLCDANGVMRPEELTDVVGRRIVISLPAGVPGTPQ